MAVGLWHLEDHCSLTRGFLQLLSSAFSWYKFGLVLSFGSDFVTCLFGFDIHICIELYILQFGIVYFCLQQYKLVILDFVTCCKHFCGYQCWYFTVRDSIQIIWCGIELLHDCVLSMMAQSDLGPVVYELIYYSVGQIAILIFAMVSSCYYRLGSAI